MSGRYVDIDMSEFREFFGKFERAARGDFRSEVEQFLEATGFDFLRVVQDEIERRQVLDSRQLLASFTRGDDGNVWELTDGGLTLEVGTNLDYAGYVNDGHWTNTAGVERRWVPGYWDGDRFIYDPAADTGMLLKQHWVEGKHYFDSALRIYDKIFQATARAKMSEWLEKYFGG